MYIFLWRNKKNIMWIPSVIWSYEFKAYYPYWSKVRPQVFLEQSSSLKVRDSVIYSINLTAFPFSFFFSQRTHMKCQISFSPKKDVLCATIAFN